MTDISPEAVGLKLRALFMSPKDIHAFVDVEEIAYAQAKRIAELEAQVAAWEAIEKGRV